MRSQDVYIDLPSPFARLRLTVSPSSTLADLPLPSELCGPLTYLRTRSSGPLSLSREISSLSHGNTSHPIDLLLGIRMVGGKGGFGSQLRAAGGRMSSGKNNNVDACRDLSGRRLSTIKEAQRQAELLESAPQLRAQAVAAEKARLEAVERSLGLTSADTAEPTASSSSNAEAGPSTSSSASKAMKRIADVDVVEIARKKHRFDDNTFLEESREIKDNVRSAVAAGLLKKKKKPKTEGAEGEGVEDKGKGKAKEVTAVQKAKDKATMPPPAVTKAAAVA